MNIDWTINIGHIVSAFSIFLAGMYAFFTVKVKVDSMDKNLESIEDRQTLFTESLNNLSKTLTQVAVQDNRLHMVEKAVDELRHGQGYIRNYKKRSED